MPSQEVKQKYDDVRMSLDKAIKASEDIKLSGEEENAELRYIRSTLGQINEDFKAEIEQLENSSEWDRFCMAFFGETNAGKSTIIEALRIIYDEETRREELVKQKQLYEEELYKGHEQYSELLNKLKQLNEELTVQKSIEKNGKIKRVIISLICIFSGIIIGFLIGYFI